MKKEKINQVLQVFETGYIKPDYDCITILHDGPGKIAQITYGKLQTTEYGNLKELIQIYCDAKGIYANSLRPYINKIGVQPLAGDVTFINFLRLAGQKDPEMAASQDILFEKRYWVPALAWFNKHSFTFDLSMLVVFDSFIQSGYVLHEIREMFSELPPDKGGDEKKWVFNYVLARRKWLEIHDNPVVRGTTYRMDNIIEIIKNGDWALEQPVTIKIQESKIIVS